MPETLAISLRTELVVRTKAGGILIQTVSPRGTKHLLALSPQCAFRLAGMLIDAADALQRPK